MCSIFAGSCNILRPDVQVIKFENETFYEVRRVVEDLKNIINIWKYL